MKQYCVYIFFDINVQLFLCTGTPSLAKPDTVEAVIASVEEKSMLASGAEVTLEANPTSALTNKLRWQVNENVG